jgi:D-alanyl-D-alanine carboxypeptidase
MTRRAHALGMASTVYRNASGLPNDEQVTTARDLTILGRSLEDRFPRYFRYFSTAQFEFDGQIIGNHNHLLGRVNGVDGIKTGYTRASGFNLLTSVHRDGRSLIAVVMGGRTAGARDRIMENLIADHIADASTARTATQIADASPAETSAREELGAQPPIRPRPAPVAEAAAQRVSTSSAEVGEGDNAAGDDEGPAPQPMLKAPTPAPTPRAAQPTTAANLGPDGAKAPNKIQARLTPDAPRLPHGRPQSSDDDRHPRASAQEDIDTATARGWMIQIGAPDSLAKANALLTRARERNGSTLASAKPLTEMVRKGDATLYRARFAVLDSASAEAACRSLKRNGFSCFPAHD